jgi:hypothetical protein
VDLRFVLLGAPTSLVRPHHAAVTHVAEVAPKWASGSTWFGWVFTESAGLSFCVLVAISPPPRQVGGRAPRDALGRHPSADPRRRAGAPPAGPWQELKWQFTPPAAA